MTKKEVQEQLSGYQDSDELFVIWWNKNFLDFHNDDQTTDKEWKTIVNKMDSYGFDTVHDQIYDVMTNELNAIRKKQEKKKMGKFSVMLIKPGGMLYEHATHSHLNDALNDYSSLTIDNAMTELNCDKLWADETIDVALYCDRDLVREEYAPGVLLAIRSFTSKK